MKRAGAAVFACAALLAATRAEGVSHVVRLIDRPPYMQPPTVEAAVGDTVIWRNEGKELVHTIIDEDLRLFSGDIPIGGEWSFTFQRAGVYTYLCSRHHFMRGAVTVRNPDGSTTAPPDHPYQPAFREFVVPTARAVPRMIIASRVDDSIWFTEGGGDFYGFEDIPALNKIARIDSGGRIVEYATPAPEGGAKVAVDSLVMDREGRVWFTERLAHRIGRLDPASGLIREYAIPTPDAHPLAIDVDVQGNIWFAERFGNRIGWMTPEGRFQEIEMPEPGSEPRTLFLDSQGRVWYTARTANEIGWYDRATGRIERLRIPTELARPTGIAETPDGSIYFVEMVGNKIGRVLGDQIIEYPLPTPFAAPFKIVSDAEGNLWFTEVFGNALGRLDPRTGEITEYRIPTPDSRPGGLAIDRQNRIWFTEQRGNKVGVFDPARARELMRAAAGVAGPAPSAPAAGTGPAIRDIPLPTPGAGPGNDLIEDGEGWIWFHQVWGNKVGAFHPASGRFREFPLLTPASMPVALARDADGAFWVAQFRGNCLARLDPASGAVEEHPLPTDAALPAGVALDEHGAVWITELGANRIARFDRRSRAFEEFPLPRPDSSPLGIAADHRGSLWISASEEKGNYLARFDLAARRFEIHDLPTAGASPIGLLVEAGAVWVAEGGIGRLARFDLARRVWDEYPIPAPGAQPVRLARDHQGRIWATDGGGLAGDGGNRLAVLDPRTGRFGLIPMARAGAKPRGILAASDGSIWFTQQNANLLSRIEPEEH